jgi:hypothetical protein
LPTPERPSTPKRSSAFAELVTDTDVVATSAICITAPIAVDTIATSR